MRPAGSGAGRGRWWIIGLGGLLWMLVGLLVLANAFSGTVDVPPLWLAAALLPDGLVSLAAALRGAGRGGWFDRHWPRPAGRPLRLLRAAAFLSVAVVVIASAGRAALATGLLVGAFLITEAVTRSVEAHRRRRRGWRGAILLALVELALGLWSLLAYPGDGAVASDVSLLIMNSASMLLILAFRLRRIGRRYTSARQRLRLRKDPQDIGLA